MSVAAWCPCTWCKPPRLCGLHICRNVNTHKQSDTGAWYTVLRCIYGSLGLKRTSYAVFKAACIDCVLYNNAPHAPWGQKKQAGKQKCYLNRRYGRDMIMSLGRLSASRVSKSRTRGGVSRVTEATSSKWDHRNTNLSVFLFKGQS